MTESSSDFHALERTWPCELDTDVSVKTGYKWHKLTFKSLESDCVDGVGADFIRARGCCECEPQDLESRLYRRHEIDADLGADMHNLV